jgi:2'-hydroxyisoflavone reductase
MGDLVDACVAASARPPVSAWVDEKTLLDFHVEPWTGLPLWLPSTDADAAGFMSVSCDRARAAGLVTRPLADTVRDTAAWLASRDNAGAWRHVLTDTRERLLLSAIDSR